MTGTERFQVPTHGGFVPTAPFSRALENLRAWPRAVSVACLPSLPLPFASAAGRSGRGREVCACIVVARCLLLAAMAALPLSSSSVSPSNKSIPACFLPCFLSKNRVVEAANPWRSPVVDGGGGHGWFDHGSPRFPIFCKQAPLRTNLTARQPWNRFASTDPAEIGGEDADLLQEGALRSESAVARELCRFWSATPVILASLALWVQLARAVPLLGTADPSGNELMVCSAVPAFKSVFVVAALVDMAFVVMMQVFFGLGASVVEGNRRWLLGMLQDVVCYAVDEIQIAVVSSSEEFLEDVIRQLWILMVRLLEHFQGGVQRDICKCFCCTSDTRQNDDFSEDGVVLPLGLILQ